MKMKTYQGLTTKCTMNCIQSHKLSKALVYKHSFLLPTHVCMGNIHEIRILLHPITMLKLTYFHTCISNQDKDTMASPTFPAGVSTGGPISIPGRVKSVS